MMQAGGLRAILAAGFAIACGAVANAGGGTNGVTLVITKTFQTWPRGWFHIP